MLTRLELTNFKSFESESVTLSPLTLLVGANASGKSNLLDAILFLQGVARGLTLTEVLRGRSEGGRQVWPGVRGGSSEIVRKGAKEMTLESDWRRELETITHRITCVAGEHPQLVSEGLSSNQPAAGPDVAKAALERRDWLVAQMRAAYFLDITPSRMRDYTPKGADFVGLTGERVSAVAWAICQDSDAKADLVDWLTELCAPELVDIDFSTTDLGDVMIVLVEKGGRRIPARSLSDGTLRFLGELIALRTAPPGSMLLMEEIENGLHPTRAHLLVEAMEAATQARGIQVIATTHSPLVLNALSPSALRQAILVARPPDSKGTLLRPLGELPDFDAVVERRGVDRLLASGWLERAL